MQTVSTQNKQKLPTNIGVIEVTINELSLYRPVGDEYKLITLYEVSLVNTKATYAKQLSKRFPCMITYPTEQGALMLVASALNALNYTGRIKKIESASK